MKKQGRNKAWLAAAIVFCAVAAAAGAIALKEYAVRKQAELARAELSDEINRIENREVTGEDQESEPVPEEPQRGWEDYTLEEKYQAYSDVYGIEVPEKNLDFGNMREYINGDIYAWIYIPNTNVDDPVVQHPEDNTYYLDHNLDGSSGYPGGIYTENCNQKDFEDRMTVIYGHNMINKTGFGSLHNFEDETFFAENRYVFIYLPDDIKVYEIFAAYEGSNNHIIYGHCWNDESWVQYLEDTLSIEEQPANAVEAYDFAAEDKVLTLSTCIRNAPNRRYLVQGVWLNAAG